MGRLKVLLLTAGFGEGHNAAAKNLGAAFAQKGFDGGDARIIDLFSDGYGLLNDWVRATYIEIINRYPYLWQSFYDFVDKTDFLEKNFSVFARADRVFAKILEAEKPDALCSVYPAYNLVANRIYASKELSPNLPPRPKQFTVITDSITINSVWTRFGSDYFFTPNEQTSAVIAGMGVEGEKVITSGFPVPLKFAGAGPSNANPGPPWNILYILNSGKAACFSLIEKLMDQRHIRLTVTTGKDTNLREKTKSITARALSPVNVEGWTPHLPEIMMRSHLCITKAGGATVQESIAAGCPLIVNQIVPGQEEGNWKLVESARCGAFAGDSSTILKTIDDAISGDAAPWRAWRKNIESVRRPTAALEIAETIIRICSKQGEPQ